MWLRSPALKPPSSFSPAFLGCYSQVVSTSVGSCGINLGDAEMQAGFIHAPKTASSEARAPAGCVGLVETGQWCESGPAAVTDRTSSGLSKMKADLSLS